MRLYLDHAATTPLLPQAQEAMQLWLTREFGNPSSIYEEGRRAKDAIDASRELLSDTLDCLFAEVLFTGSGTEAANMALIGTALANEDPNRNRVLIGAAEHHCVLHTKPVLEQLGFQVELIPVDREAVIDMDAFEEMLGDDVLLVSVMHANNELGTLQPVRQIADMCHAVGALYHCDAIQTFLLPVGPDSRPWTVADIDADLLTLSGHKVYGPKGVGAIYIRAGVKPKPILVGGGQEREMRAGTENIPAIVGFAEAIMVLRSTVQSDAAARRAARDEFLRHLGPRFIPSVSSYCNVLPGHAHVRLEGVQAETMLILLDRMGLSASSGAACSSGSLEPSHVLLACGFTNAEAAEGLRFTFGKDSTPELAVRASKIVCEALERIEGKRPAR